MRAIGSASGSGMLGHDVEHDVEVVGISAGGIDPLLELVANLPANLPASLFVVHRFPAHSISALPSIL